MSDIQNYADKALCSKAAYADFTAVAGKTIKRNADGTVDTDNAVFTEASKVLREQAGFSEAEAISFLNRFDIKGSYLDSSSGLSFNIFENLKTEQLEISSSGKSNFDTKGLFDTIKEVGGKLKLLIKSCTQIQTHIIN